MTELTDFKSTEDVSDAAIEWVRANVFNGEICESVAEVRKHAGGTWSYAKAALTTARLIQAHRPDLLVDPVDAIVREIVAQRYDGDYPSLAVDVRAGGYNDDAEHAMVKRAYLMGKESK